MGKLAVVAVGGNSLIKDKDHQSIPDQYAAGAESMAHIAGMIEAGWEVVITHGNGPQVGFILRRAELALHELHPVPLDYCGADTQGAIGYMFQQALYNEFLARGIARQAATVVTQVLVDRNDPAFQNPSKPIGSFMDEPTALGHRQEDGWAVEKVAINYNKPGQRWLDRMSLAEARSYSAEGHFLKGSMAPKIQAIVSYLEQGGKQALITDPENIERALEGHTGTWIVP